MKKRLLKTLIMSSVLLTGCRTHADSSTPMISESTSTVDNEIQKIYESYKANGGTLSYEEWLASIRGKDGMDGKDGKDGFDGKTPYIGENGNWWIEKTDTGVKATGSDGKTAWSNTILPSTGGYVLSSSGSAVEGEDVTFTAYPDSGYRLKSLLLNGSEQEMTNNSVTVKMVNGGFVVQAYFEVTIEKVELTMSVYYDNNDRHMKFIEGAAATLPYASVDGNSYKAGDFKPVWKAIQKNLNIKIDDVSPTGKVSIKDNFSTLVSQAFKANDKEVNIAQGNSDQILSEGTTKGTILDLNAYLDQMPNFKKFLDDNPVVKKTISAADGKIYYAPYFDGYDDLEKMMMLRQDWVEKLLDGVLPTTLDSTVVSSKYQPFYTTDINSTVDVLNAADDTATAKATITKNIPAAKNIIKQMNDTANLTGAQAVKMLRDYIDEIYGTTYGTKRSELFCGGKAVYDVDELVALFRCVKANAKFLTGKDDVNIVPLFPRAKTSDRTTDLYRFLQFFGVRGVEARNQWFYVNKEGKLVDTRGTAEFATGLEKLHEMYSEGLIMQGFTDTQISGKDDYRGPFYTCATDSKTIGFATYDYNQTTTAYNDTTKDSAMKLVSILPATADWDDGSNGNFIHYTESWRSVKTQGWFITDQTAKDSKKLAKALKLFDYLYSDEGNRLMSYGPDEYLEKNADGSIKTMDYQGKQVPVLSTGCKNEMKTLASGNYTNYYRYYLGGTLPVGYIKEQGMEYQAVSTKAQPSLNVLNKAIQYGVLQHVNHKTDNANHFYDIVPTTLPFTQAENTNLGYNFTALNTAFTFDKTKVMTISKVVIDGWGTYDSLDFSSKEKYLTTIKTTLNTDGFTTIYNDGYTRFKAL